MKMHNSRLFRFAIALLGFVAVFTVPRGQGQGVAHNRIPLAEDWSSRHLIYSSSTDAQRNYQIKQQYRYWNQLLRRNARVQMPTADKAFVQFFQPQDQKDRGMAFSGVPNRNGKDGGGPNPVEAGSSTVTTAVPSTVSGASSQLQHPWTIQSVGLLFAALFLLALALRLKGTRRRRLVFGLALGLVAGFLSLQIGCASSNSVGTSQSAAPQSLQRDWQASLTTSAGVGEGMYPAKFSFNVNAAASCANDFVVFNTRLTGNTSLSIVAFNNLYAGAGGICAGPSVLFAYQTKTNAGASGTFTSPTLSLDGAQVAYMEGQGGQVGTLHILRWKSGDGGTVAAPVLVTTRVTTGANYVTCKGTNTSCLLSLTFANGAGSSFSAPFYDFDTDALYVGDDNGSLHKFTGVFNGTPAEVTTGGWPIAVHGGHNLTSPVVDNTSGNIFVTDRDGTLSYVRESTSTIGACGSGSPPCLGSTTVAVSGNNNSITDPPIVDSTQGRVLAFTGNNTDVTFGGANVVQANTALSGVARLDVGVGSNFNLHIGAFDNAYFASIATGHLYVCANSGANSGSASGTVANNEPTLKRISFNANGTVNSVDAGTLLLATSSTTCSPVTELINGGTDRIFMSVQANGISGCGGNGCIMSVVIPTASPFTFPAAVKARLPEPGGTSGIVIDNVSSAGQASSLYFTILGNSTGGLTCSGVANVGCAVKATQSGLN